MNAPLSMVDLAGVVLPHGSRDSGLLAMIRAYFDDSGTHGGSDMVVMAGLIGYPNQWDYLSNLWAKRLAEPCPGRSAIQRFHMAPCQASDEEFLGWKRIETDYLVDELIEIICKAGVYGFGCGLSRETYDELVTGDQRRANGNAETSCTTNCFLTLVRDSQAVMGSREIALIFDDRPQQRRNVERIYDVYRGVQDNGVEIASVTFANSKKIIPLQAADLLAWEVYQDCLDFLNGHRVQKFPRRRQLGKLLETARIRIEYGGPEEIRKMAAMPVDPKVLADIANHLDFK